MVQLDIVTPVTRPENLSEIGKSLLVANRYFDVCWYKIHDCKVGGCENLKVSCLYIPGPPGDAGWTQRNWHLDHGRPDAWVCWHDDDTVMHPDLAAHLADHIKAFPYLRAIVYAMKYVHLPDQPVMVGQPGNVQIGSISGSMVIFRRDFVGTQRAYTERMADGMFWQKVMRNAPPDTILWTDKPYILFNSLNPGKPE